MPTNLSTFRDYLLPPLNQYLSNNLDILYGLDIEIDYPADALVLVAYYKVGGLWKYNMGQSFLMPRTPADVFAYMVSHIERHKLRHVPSTEGGAEQYDDIMQAQAAMAKVSPQS